MEGQGRKNPENGRLFATLILDKCKGALTKEKTCMAAYFASRIGSPLEKSTEGVIRTLLLQIAPKHEAILTALTRTYSNRRAQQGTSWEWTAEELLQLLEIHLIQTTGTAFYIFIDGLDECPENEARDLVAYFRTLTASAAAAKANVNVCLSSRCYPNIAAPLCPEILVETYNGDDISRYVHTRLFLDRKVQPDINETFAADITQSAFGSFLWASLVVAQLNQDFDKGGSLDIMRTRVVKGYHEIDERYTALFEDISAEESHEIQLFWQCIIVSARSLTLVEFDHLVRFAKDSPPTSLDQWIRSQSNTDSNSLKRRINTLSRGLVEVTLKQPPLRRTAGLLEVPRVDQLSASREESREEEIPGDGAEEIVVDHNGGEESSEEFDLSPLLELVDWKAGIQFTLDVELDAETLNANSTWRTFLEEGWEPVPLDHSDPQNYILDTVHDSVREFFTEKNGFDMVTRGKSMGTAATHVGQGHETLARACYEYINVAELKVLSHRPEEDSQQLNFPDLAKLDHDSRAAFAEYAFQYLGFHARAVEDCNMPVKFLLTSPFTEVTALVGQWGMLPGRRVELDHRGIRSDCSHYVSLLHFLCGEGLLRTAEFYLKQTALGHEALDTLDRRGQSPLYYVLRRARLFRSDGQMAHLARALLEHGANPNLKTLKHESLLSVAVQGRLFECVTALVESGANVNMPGDYGKTPLDEAVSVGSENLKIITLLLSRRAQPARHGGLHWLCHIFSIFGGLQSSCALYRSMSISSPEVIELLLTHVPPYLLDARDVEQLFGAVLERGRYDCLTVMLKSPRIQNVVTLPIIGSLRQSLAEQREIVERGETWTPPTVFGLKWGASVPNTFDAKDAEQVNSVLNTITKNLEKGSVVRRLWRLFMVSALALAGGSFLRQIVLRNAPSWAPSVTK
ncbi:hypothetical protein N7467_001246 [Penicillium canescens]|nr:hypothetical protein N7467_001246 [Penicillium canescens]